MHEQQHMQKTKKLIKRHNHKNGLSIEPVQQTYQHVILPKGLTYPENWPAMYLAKDKQRYACHICNVHTDDIEPYYTIQVLEGPFVGERQTVPERLSSWVDTLNPKKIQRTFLKFIQDTKISPRF